MLVMEIELSTCRLLTTRLETSPVTFFTLRVCGMSLTDQRTV